MDEKKVRKEIAWALGTRIELIEIVSEIDDGEVKLVRFRKKVRGNGFEYMAIIKGMDRPLLYKEI